MRGRLGWSGCRIAGAVVGAAIVAAYVWWATGRRPFTATATLAVVGGGVVAMAIGHGRRRPRDDSDLDQVRATDWPVLFAAVAAWQLLAYVQAPRSEHPTLSSLTNTALEGHASRALALAGWLLGASWLARR